MLQYRAHAVHRTLASASGWYSCASLIILHYSTRPSQLFKPDGPSNLGSISLKSLSLPSSSGTVANLASSVLGRWVQVFMGPDHSAEDFSGKGRLFTVILFPRQRKPAGGWRRRHNGKDET